MKIKKKDSKRKQEINTEVYLKKKKNKKKEYGRNRYHNMSKENKQKLKEYKKKIAMRLKKQKTLDFFIDLIMRVMCFSHTLLNLQ